jgi:hypothetical protein
VAASYDVAGFGLRAEASSGPLLEPVHRLLGRFQSDALPPSAWELRIERGDLDRPAEAVPGLQRIWSGPVMPDLQGVNYVGPGLRRMELCGHGRLDLDLTAGRASILLPPDAPARCAGYFLVPLLCEGLAAAGHCVVHAACLAAPVRRDTRSVLIVAKSGTGKSTTALALTNGGWKLMGDDIALVSRFGGNLRAWGFPRVCHVRRPTLRLLPWLTELALVPLSTEDAFDLPLEALGDRAWPAAPPALEPALLLCLDPPNGETHRLRPLDRAEALMHLAEENVQPIEGCADAAAQRAFGAFAELVQRTPAFRLSVGPRVERLADFLTEELSL